MDPQVELVDRWPARTLRLPSAMLLPDWARWGARLVGFTRERAAIIYDEREFDEEDLPTSRRDLASFIRENDSVHFLQDYNLVISRAVWVPKAAGAGKTASDASSNSASAIVRTPAATGKRLWRRAPLKQMPVVPCPHWQAP